MADYRDGAGIRRWVTCQSRHEADAVLAERVRESHQRTVPAVDPNLTFARYSERWQSLIATSVKRGTLSSYEQNLRLYILPVFGATRVRDLTRGRIRAFLADKMGSGLSRNSVRIIHATLRASLNAAIDDGLILANPAERLGRQLRLVTPTATRQEEVKAMTREQLTGFLVTAQKERRYFPLFFAMARTGMRLGEALGLQWDDLDHGARELRVARALVGGRVESPKSGHARSVDVSSQLARLLLRLQVGRKAETLRRGWSGMPPWVFCSEAGGPLDGSRVRKTFRRALKAAGLALHFTPHSLRHTFASLLLQQGESPAYVQRQLGHSSIKLTVDTYGRWLPMGNKAAVDRLDDRTGSRTVAGGVFGGTGATELAELSGAGGGS